MDSGLLVVLLTSPFPSSQIVCFLRRLALRNFCTIYQHSDDICVFFSLRTIPAERLILSLLDMGTRRGVPLWDHGFIVPYLTLQACVVTGTQRIRNEM
jgi:hypothetical protein